MEYGIWNGMRALTLDGLVWHIKLTGKIWPFSSIVSQQNGQITRRIIKTKTLETNGVETMGEENKFNKLGCVFENSNESNSLLARYSSIHSTNEDDIQWIIIRKLWNRETGIWLWRWRWQLLLLKENKQKKINRKLNIKILNIKYSLRNLHKCVSMRTNELARNWASVQWQASFNIFISASNIRFNQWGRV